MNSILKPSLVALFLCSGALPVVAETKEQAIQRLSSSGYTNIKVKTTWLGRTKIEARKGRSEYEVVLSKTGVVLREVVKLSGDDNDDHESETVNEPEVEDDDDDTDSGGGDSGTGGDDSGDDSGDDGSDDGEDDDVDDDDEDDDDDENDDDDDDD